MFFAAVMLILSGWTSENLYLIAAGVGILFFNGCEYVRTKRRP